MRKDPAQFLSESKEIADIIARVYKVVYADAEICRLLEDYRTRHPERSSAEDFKSYIRQTIEDLYDPYDSDKVIAKALRHDFVNYLTMLLAHADFFYVLLKAESIFIHQE